MLNSRNRVRLCDSCLTFRPLQFGQKKEQEIRLWSNVGHDKRGYNLHVAVMTGGFGLIEETQGYVAVSDGLNSGSHIVVTSEPGEWFSVSAWLPGDRLVLQSHYAGPDRWPAVWTARTDGSGLVKLTDGVFLAKFDG